MSRLELQIWRRLLRADYMMRLSVEFHELKCARDYAALDTLYVMGSSQARRVYRRVRRAMRDVGGKKADAKTPPSTGN